MRDDEADIDEREFAALQLAASNLPPPARRRRNARAAAAKVREARESRKATFVKVPLWWIEQATLATRAPQAFVCIWLLHLAWKAKSNTFPVPNGLLEMRGIDRRTKRRALAALEAAGMITVNRSDGKTPVVTLVVR